MAYGTKNRVLTWLKKKYAVVLQVLLNVGITSDHLVK